MAELAVTDGMPPPDDLPRGEFAATVSYDHDDHRAGIRIDRADPRILISALLLGAIADDPQPYAWLEPCPCTPDHLHVPHVGATLRIHGVNRTVIYRITDYVPRVHGYIGEWPD